MVCVKLGAAITADRAVAADVGSAPAPTVLMQRGGRDLPYTDARSAVAAARAGDTVWLSDLTLKTAAK
jgi:hypothetical protein